MAKPSLFDIKSNMNTLQTEMDNKNDYLAKSAADPAVKMEDIEKAQKEVKDLETRMAILQKQHDELETEQRRAVEKQMPANEKDEAMTKKAAYYRAVALGDKTAIEKTYSGLGAIPAGSADFGNGSALLPTTLSTEITTEPAEENSLRGLEQTTQVAGLEEPRLAFEIDDEDLLEDVIDAETAKEIAVSADTVSYGRYKTKVKIRVADTVVLGAPAQLVTEVENGLKSALARKEKLRAFAKSADDDHKHMSFYMVGIKGVTGTTIVKAIMACLGDLPDAFRARASVLMRSADWYSYVDAMANSAVPLYGKKPEDIIGVPVKFNDQASIPIVGDFNFAKQNYDPMATLDSDKDIDSGMYKFVLTTWSDHQIKLKSAFRLAIVAVAIIGGIAKSATSAALAGEVVTATATFNTDDASKPTSGITYLWQAKVNGTWTDLTNAYTGYNGAALTTVNSQDETVEFRCKITYGGVSVYTNSVTMA